MLFDGLGFRRKVGALGGYFNIWDLTTYRVQEPSGRLLLCGLGFGI